jgi:hypothetical protein
VPSSRIGAGPPRPSAEATIRHTGLSGRWTGDWRLAAEVTIRGEEGNIWIGALAGYAASRTMDAATSWFYSRQSEESKHREEELAPGGTLVKLGKQLGAATGRDLDDEAAGKVGLAVHRALGVSYGIAASALVKRGTAPMNAGLTVGSAAFVLIDEGTAISQFSAYPVASHLRGVVGHATLGLTLGVLPSLTFRR